MYMHVCARSFFENHAWGLQLAWTWKNFFAHAEIRLSLSEVFSEKDIFPACMRASASTNACAHTRRTTIEYGPFSFWWRKIKIRRGATRFLSDVLHAFWKKTLPYKHLVCHGYTYACAFVAFCMYILVSHKCLRGKLLTHTTPRFVYLL